MDLFGEMSGVEHLLGFHLQRHSVLSGNLANADTPNFVAQDLTFAGTMNQASSLRTTSARHIPTGGGAAGGHAEEGELVQAPAVDGNGVQVEHTLAQITANRLSYEKGLEMWNRRAALMRYVATDGSGS